MRRREPIKMMGCVVAGPIAARAEPDRVRRTGVLTAHPVSDPEFLGYMAAFREGLERLWPVQAPTKYQLVIVSKTAKGLGFGKYSGRFSLKPMR